MAIFRGGHENGVTRDGEALEVVGGLGIVGFGFVDFPRRATGLLRYGRQGFKIRPRSAC